MRRHVRLDTSRSSACTVHSSVSADFKPDSWHVLQKFTLRELRPGKFCGTEMPSGRITPPYFMATQRWKVKFKYFGNSS